MRGKKWGSLVFAPACMVPCTLMGVPFVRSLSKSRVLPLMRLYFTFENEDGNQRPCVRDVYDLCVYICIHKYVVHYLCISFSRSQHKVKWSKSITPELHCIYTKPSRCHSHHLFPTKASQVPPQQHRPKSMHQRPWEPLPNYSGPTQTWPPDSSTTQRTQRTLKRPRKRRRPTSKMIWLTRWRMVWPKTSWISQW